MIYLSPGTCTFEFVVVTALRAKQLAAGCVPRVTPASRHTNTAALEVMTGKVSRVVTPASLPAIVD